MELYKVLVKEERNFSDGLVEKFVDETFKVYEPLEKQGDYYLMVEYSRERSLLQIGVKEERATSILVEMDGILLSLQKSVQQTDFWYESSVRWEEGFFASQQEATFGKNAAGIATVKSFDADDKLIDKKSILILPGTFSFKQYEMMKIEVQYYLENIASTVMSDNVEPILKGIDIPLYSISKIVSFIDRLTDSLQRIIDNPAEILIQEKKKLSQNKIKNWNSQLLIERTLKGPHKKLIVSKMEKSTVIQEHQMLRGIVDSVSQFVYQLKMIELGLVDQFEHEKKIREEKLQYTSQRDELQRKSMRKRILLIEDNIRLLNERHDQWLELENELSRLLNEKLLQVEAKPFHMTHYFQYNPQYRKIVFLYEEWKNLVPKLEKIHQNFIEHVLSSPKLYQLWVLIQLIKEIEKYGYVAEQPIWDSLLTYYETHRELDHWRMLFQGENGSRLLLGYEILTKSHGGKQLQPDYLIAYQKNNNDQWLLHILDAKYKPYSAMKHGVRLLKHDLERSAKRYVDTIVLNQLTQNLSAALIHTDTSICNWDVSALQSQGHRNQQNLYRLSHFALLPGNVEGLKTYMKRLFHYFHKICNLCPSCGKTTQPLSPGWKETYICEEDHEVWVKSTCNHCKERPRIQLMKYATENYNEQVAEEWNVHCPKCQKDFHGNIVKFDLFGRR